MHAIQAVMAWFQVLLLYVPPENKMKFLCLRWFHQRAHTVSSYGLIQVIFVGTFATGTQTLILTSFV